MARTNTQTSQWDIADLRDNWIFLWNLTALGRTRLWLALAADGKRVENIQSRPNGPRLSANWDPTGCEDVQGTLHPHRIAAGDIEASYSSDWPIPCATPKLFTAQWPGSGPSSGRVLGGPRGEEKSRTSGPRASLSFAKLKEPREAGRPMIPQPNQWNVVFAHPAFPKECGAPADWHSTAGICVIWGRPLISSPPRAPPSLPRCHTRSHS